MPTKLKDFPGEPTVEELFPSTQDRVTLALQGVFIAAFTVATYRSAYKRNWGAAIWKALVLHHSVNELNRWVERRAAKNQADRAVQVLEKQHNIDRFFTT